MKQKLKLKRNKDENNVLDLLPSTFSSSFHSQLCELPHGMVISYLSGNMLLGTHILSWRFLVFEG